MKKLFTFFAAAMLCCAINASVIEWNMSEASLQDLDVSWNNGETTVENNSQKGIIKRVWKLAIPCLKRVWKL